MDSTNSTTFIKRPFGRTLKEECLIYTKEVLSGRLFLGLYQERRYVPQLDQYRDVVVVNRDEMELQMDIEKVTAKWRNVEDVKWVGITCPNDGYGAYKFWLKLSNVSFDNYWFQIKHVKLIDDELLVQLKIIRKCTLDCLSISQKRQIQNVASSPQTDSNIPSYEIFPKNLLTSMKDMCQDAITNIQPHLTQRNFCNVSKNVVAMFLGLTCVLASCIHSLGVYFLKLIRELSILIQAITPIISQLLDLLTKLIGGVFILIAAMLGLNRVVTYPDAKSSLPPNVNWRERNRNLRRELYLK